MTALIIEELMHQSSSSDSSSSTTDSTSSSDESGIAADDNSSSHAHVSTFLQTIEAMSEEDFRSNFRVNRTTSLYLIDMYIEHKDGLNVRNRSREMHQLAGDKEMLMFLWYLANTITFRQLAILFGVSKSTAWNVVVKISSWMVTLSNIYIRWPLPHEIVTVSNKFEERQHIPHVIGAIDVTHIGIKKPIIHGTDYYNKKQYYSLSLQAVVDADKKFTDIYCGEPGSLHDARILRKSKLFSNILDNPESMFINNCFILGDSAYPAKNWLITPFRNNGHLTNQQRRFNFIHSSTRMVVENAFGLLKIRFRRLLHFTEHVHLNLLVNLIVSACILHNICIIQNDEFPVDDLELQPEEPIIEENVNLNGTERRQTLINELIENGVL